MRIVVCVKQTAAGDLNPFDACAYEAVLQIPDGEVILLSTGPDMWIVGETPRSFAESIGKDIVVICKEEFMSDRPHSFEKRFAAYVQEKQPEVILWGSDAWSKAVAPK
jgi:electron transfer flavoprotein alpha/beta subunit